MKYEAKRITMLLRVLAVFLLAGCGKEDRYLAESDSYQCIFMVDAWEVEFREQDYENNQV